MYGFRFTPFEKSSAISCQNSNWSSNFCFLATLDAGSIVALIMLDLSAAFDVIDPPILIRRLKFAFGISGSALDWIVFVCL
jgi:hypothetical protein